MTFLFKSNVTNVTCHEPQQVPYFCFLAIANPKMLSKTQGTLKPKKEETEIRIGMELEAEQQVAKKVIQVKRQIASQMKIVVGEKSKGEMRERLMLWTLLARARRSKQILPGWDNKDYFLFPLFRILKSAKHNLGSAKGTGISCTQCRHVW